MSLDLVQNKFRIESKFTPSGDQPNAIKLLTEGLNKGVKDVYQLEGGIINYLSQTKNRSKNWYGECFVFDERVSINDKLQKGIYSQCFACRSPVTESEMNSTFYKKGVSCPNCYRKTSPQKKERFEERERQIKIAKKKGIRHLGS